MFNFKKEDAVLHGCAYHSDSSDGFHLRGRVLSADGFDRENDAHHLSATFDRRLLAARIQNPSPHFIYDSARGQVQSFTCKTFFLNFGLKCEISDIYYSLSFSTSSQS